MCYPDKLNRSFHLYDRMAYLYGSRYVGEVLVVAYSRRLDQYLVVKQSGERVWVPDGRLSGYRP